MNDLYESLGSSGPFLKGIVNWPELPLCKVWWRTLRSLQADGARRFVSHRQQGWELINQLNIIVGLRLINRSVYLYEHCNCLEMQVGDYKYLLQQGFRRMHLLKRRKNGGEGSCKCDEKRLEPDIASPLNTNCSRRSLHSICTCW